MWGRGDLPLTTFMASTTSSLLCLPSSEHTFMAPSQAPAGLAAGLRPFWFSIGSFRIVPQVRTLSTSAKQALHRCSTKTRLGQDAEGLNSFPTMKGRTQHTGMLRTLGAEQACSLVPVPPRSATKPREAYQVQLLPEDSWLQGTYRQSQRAPVSFFSLGALLSSTAI